MPIEIIFPEEFESEAHREAWIELQRTRLNELMNESERTELSARLEAIQLRYGAVIDKLNDISRKR